MACAALARSIESFRRPEGPGRATRCVASRPREPRRDILRVVGDAWCEIVVVTGCCGRIGRAVANTLCVGRKVRGFDSNPRPQGLLSDIELVHGRLEDADAVSAAISGADAVVHLAACPDDADLAEALVPANILGVSNVLDACRRAGVKQVVVASSGKVHPSHGRAITLSTPTSVVCSYGATALRRGRSAGVRARCARRYGHRNPLWCPGRRPTSPRCAPRGRSRAGRRRILVARGRGCVSMLRCVRI